MATSARAPLPDVEVLRTPDGDPVGVVERPRWTPLKVTLWTAVALLGGVAWTMIAVVRGEQVSTIWFIVASLCTYTFA